MNKFYSKSFLNKKQKFLTNKYKGIGKPKKIDYSYSTPFEISKMLNHLFNLQLDNIKRSVKIN